MTITLEDIKNAALGIKMAYKTEHIPTQKDKSIQRQKQLQETDAALTEQLKNTNNNLIKKTPFFKNNSPIAAGYVIETDQEIMICYRGTLDRSEILNDLSLNYYRMTCGDQSCNVHSGFMDEYLQSKESLKNILQKTEKPLIFSGHSLGGAVATIAALDFKTNETATIKGVVTLGSPRVLSPNAAKLYNNLGLGNDTMRIELKFDPFTKIPPYGPYQHVGINIKGHALSTGEWLKKPTANVHKNDAYIKFSNKIIPEQLNSIESYIQLVLRLTKEAIVYAQNKLLIKNISFTKTTNQIAYKKLKRAEIRR